DKRGEVMMGVPERSYFLLPPGSPRSRTRLDRSSILDNFLPVNVKVHSHEALRACNGAHRGPCAGRLRGLGSRQSGLEALRFRRDEAALWRAAAADRDPRPG